LSLPTLPYLLLTERSSTTDEDALRAKVEEALNVYDEYVKNQGGEQGGAPAQPNGTENLNPNADEAKNVEA
jgi:polyadenylate-binding protein